MPVADSTGWFRYWVSIQRDITTIKSLEEKVLEERDKFERSSLTDDLTGLYNRRGFEEKCRFLLNSNSSTERKRHLLIVDLDKFKIVNDQFGHDAGDTVLKEIALRLKEAVSPICDVCRSGGDEFLLNCVAESIPDISSFIENLLRRLAEPIRYEGAIIECHCSIGAASGSIQDIVSGDLLKKADFALYRGKSSVRGGAIVFSPAMRNDMEMAMSLRRDLPAAVRDGYLSVSYMAKVCAHTGEIIGLEGLARWSHDQWGILLPSQFLPIAVQLGVLAQIDAYMLEKIVKEVRRLRLQGLTVPAVSVNTSNERLKDASFIHDLATLEVRRDEISIELLESNILDEIGSQEQFAISELRRRKIEVEIDDFGAGYASILSLTTISPDRLKIDRRLVADVVSEKRAQRLVQLIAEIGRALGISVLAEGVESQEQALLLRDLGCDCFQGYLFGQPCPSMQASVQVSLEASRFLVT